MGVKMKAVIILISGSNTAMVGGKDIYRNTEAIRAQGSQVN